jgi:hypothetical protein
MPAGTGTRLTPLRESRWYKAKRMSGFQCLKGSSRAMSFSKSLLRTVLHA